MNLLFAYVPTLIMLGLVIAAEHLSGALRTDWWRNLQSWALYLLGGLTVLPFVRGWSGAALIDGATLPFWAGFAIFFVVRDLGEYLFHRAQHAIPLLWSMHALHHSDPQMSALTTQRHYWADQLFKTITIWSAAAAIIMPTPQILAAASMAGLWNIAVHANVRLDLGRWSWLINSPAYHRRHHSRLPEHYNSNFAALLPIFDVIAGTYRRPDGWPPTGLERKPESLLQVLAWPLYRERPAAETGTPRVSEG